MTTSSPATPDVFGGGRSDVARRLDGLTQAVAASRGRIDEEILAPAEMLTERAAERLVLSGEHTIVALAGATGSGKSSLFNSLTDLELAGVGVRRPTTSWALACAWGPDGAQGLLEWMGIPARHQVSRMSMLDHSAEDTKLDGLVLLDLPDHDSTEVSHHLEMDRLVTYADLLVWVLDPQKYADAAIHDRYIRPMASYSDVTLVVLNQIDRIPFEQRDRALADVRRILADEGLPDVPVIGVSATRGDGVDDLKRELASRIRAKSSAKARLSSDIAAAAAVIEQVGGTSPVPTVSETTRRTLDDALLDCAGVPQLVEAIESSTRRRAALHTGWPVARWLGRLGGDPLEELQLDPGLSLSSLARSALPEAGNVQRASAELAIRDVADQASTGLARSWRDAVREAANPEGEDIVGELDTAIHATSVDVSRPAAWWRVVHAVQLLAVVAAVVGLLWLVAQGVTSFSSVELPDIGSVAGVPTAAVVVAGALVGGIVLAAVSSVAARAGGRRKARRADEALRAAIDRVAAERVVAPIQRELDQYASYRAGIVDALS
ncbi:GTPase [Aeromicrobium fastidiosum]|uniref:ABC transporter n=1 Tax=Aeromicrobium fastidiosum TaxID=52699 RepID=A0A641AHL0_9ACTN|nr:GTPase [Aeromicrobium fastidiosum]KAA1373602.1 ABC transporter [Aeromicrobium fastidiosum]MBP2391151.1 GTP-binding protein EngB required for normal cell division [Aeromicrobium fastidiosum]